MKILTLYQKLVLRLLCAILWRLVHKNDVDSGLFSDVKRTHSDLINKAQDEVYKG